jgi:hypothetical protein
LAKSKAIAIFEKQAKTPLLETSPPSKHTQAICAILLKRNNLVAKPRLSTGKAIFLAHDGTAS